MCGIWDGWELPRPPKMIKGQSRKKCTSVSPPARFGKTTGSHPKVPLKIFLYWSDCEDINC